MRIAILNTDYEPFLRSLYAQNPGLKFASYSEQLRIRNESLFGVADFYSEPISRLGHEGIDLRVNNIHSQRAWASERGFRFQETKWSFSRKKRVIPWVRRIDDDRWYAKTLERQIETLQPDVIWNQAPDGISCEMMRPLKAWSKLIVAQQAAAYLDANQDWTVYDLGISSFPPRMEWFRERGIETVMNRLGFPADVAGKIGPLEQDIPLTFVGSMSKVHESRVEFLERVAEKYPLAFWGTGVEILPERSALRKCYRGEAWGREMFQILGRSQISLNHHGSIPPYANNMRLYEATGMGSMLLTDWKENLHEMFEPEREVSTYRDTEEALERIGYYFTHPEERKRIAERGRERTMSEHTYEHRIREMLPIFERLLKGKSPSGSPPTSRKPRDGKTA